MGEYRLVNRDDYPKAVQGEPGEEFKQGWNAAMLHVGRASVQGEPADSEGKQEGGELRYIKQRYDFFWVFVPKHDAWRLGRCSGALKAVVLYGDGLWVVHPDLDESWEAVGVEMPRHPRAVTIPKTAAPVEPPSVPSSADPRELFREWNDGYDWTRHISDAVKDAYCAGFAAGARSVSPLEDRESLEGQVRRLTEAINWACGCGDGEFSEYNSDGSKKPRYWWRTELKKIGGLAWDKEKLRYVLVSEPPSGAQHDSQQGNESCANGRDIMQVTQ